MVLLREDLLRCYTVQVFTFTVNFWGVVQLVGHRTVNAYLTTQQIVALVTTNHYI